VEAPGIGFDIEDCMPSMKRGLELVVGIDYIPRYLSNKTEFNCQRAANIGVGDNIIKSRLSTRGRRVPGRGSI
jgi:hypothetical protein